MRSPERRLDWRAEPPRRAGAADEMVYVTRTGSKYHRAGCRFLARNSTAIRLTEVGRYQPCGVCHPPH
jgi:hypothetical protein